jgi:hypothetical protein
VIAHPDAGLRLAAAGFESTSGAEVASLRDALSGVEARVRPLFGASEERLRYESASLSERLGAAVPDLSVYYRVEAPAERLEELAGKLQKRDAVAAAYIKPPAEPPQINDMAPLAEETPATPDFSTRQGYLDAAPGGIDARYAWTQPGGRGAGVQVIDIEGAWRFSHEDLKTNQGGVVGGTQSTDIGWRNHGTAVAGEISGDVNTVGITGIAADANIRAISIFGSTGSAGAIRMAAGMLHAGDIILIELHRPGPRFNYQGRQDQMGYIAVEWWPDDYDAIRYATGLGVIIVEAGGNGAQNLDDPIYNNPGPGFPASWRNPFNRNNRDSGAIIVGAGAPPPGTHGANHGPDRSRLDFSNYGSCVDAQGWGREVTTTGYGDLQGGQNEDVWYTDRFSGTSSASPIIVGALACAQGVLRARGSTIYTPATARQALRTKGSPQQDAPGRPSTQRIGMRPDLRKMVGISIKLKDHIKNELKEHIKPEVKDKPEIKEKVEIKEHKPEIKEHVKVEAKELKPEVKEAQKELKEHKPEIKENNKEFKEHKGEVEKLRDKIREKLADGAPPPSGDPMGQSADVMQLLAIIAQRLDDLEARLASGQAFIRPEERPDVGGQALNQPRE